MTSTGTRNTPQEFRLYEANGDQVPEMVHAGMGYRFHVTGLTHDERGYPSSSPEVHDALVNRLVDKIRLHANEIEDHEELFVDDAETIVVAFGCTARSARHAVNEARAAGIRAGLLRPKTIWPFPETRLRELIAAGRVTRFVVPEINLGQLRREVERLTDLPIARLNHAGGAMPEPAAILELLRP